MSIEYCELKIESNVSTAASKESEEGIILGIIGFIVSEILDKSDWSD